MIRCATVFQMMTLTRNVTKPWAPFVIETGWPLIPDCYHITISYYSSIAGLAKIRPPTILHGYPRIFVDIQIAVYSIHTDIGFLKIHFKKK